MGSRRSRSGLRKADALGRRVATVAAALQAIDGDALYQDCTTVLLRAVGQGITLVAARRLAGAHVAYAEGRKLTRPIVVLTHRSTIPMQRKPGRSPAALAKGGQDST